ncbi:hypothetical protein GUJ93_ZPchr0009g1416 [Zizania palustris]|uniref:Translation initiation factor IF- 2 domain-containing protein n=1 Tax=Zizania palustris TaxID=103762 RepID=A0A8J5R4F4_ZIZPA|nr:hypothetical protein GUJ93_ZPchr0009g1416 [Zizania palustris]
MFPFPLLATHHRLPGGHSSMPDTTMPIVAGGGRRRPRFLCVLFSSLGTVDTHDLNVILRVDFQGSIEAISQDIQVLPRENVCMRFLLHVPRDVSVSDIDLAVSS